MSSCLLDILRWILFCGEDEQQHNRYNHSSRNACTCFSCDRNYTYCSSVPSSSKPCSLSKPCRSFVPSPNPPPSSKTPQSSAPWTNLSSSSSKPVQSSPKASQSEGHAQQSKIHKSLEDQLKMSFIVPASLKRPQSPSYSNSSPKTTLGVGSSSRTSQPEKNRAQQVVQRYEIPKHLEEQINKDIVPEVLTRPLSPSTYADYFAIILYAEDLYIEVAPGPSNGLDPAAALHVAPPQWGAKSNYKGNGKKRFKPTKVAQSAYCAVCKLDCNSQEVLNTHKQGKKHKKSLQKLQESITPKPQRGQVTTYPVEKKEAPDPAPAPDKGKKETLAPAPAPAPDKGKTVPNEGNTATRNKAKIKAAAEEDVETKMTKMIEGGAEPKEVRVCILCNVVVNSEKVYVSHVSGSKHAAMVKKQQEASAS